MTTSKRTFAAALALLMLAGLCFAVCARADGPLVVLVASPPASVEYAGQVEITMQLLGGAPPYTVTLRYTIIEGGTRYPFVRTEEDSTGRVQFFIPVRFGQSMEYTLHVTDTGGGTYDSAPKTVTFTGTPSPQPLSIRSARVDADHLPQSGDANLVLELSGGTASYDVRVILSAVSEGNTVLGQVADYTSFGHDANAAVPILPPGDLLRQYPEAEFLEVTGTVSDLAGRLVALPQGLWLRIHYPLTGTLSLDKTRLLPGEAITASVSMSGGTPPYSCEFHWYCSSVVDWQDVRRTLSSAGSGIQDSWQADYGSLTPPFKDYGGLDLTIRDSVWGRLKINERFDFGALGDVYGDGRIDLKDLALMMDYALRIGDPVEWSRNADMTGDRKIDIDDVQLLINLLVK